jgi:hypothetical protein
MVNSISFFPSFTSSLNRQGLAVQTARLGFGCACLLS